MALIQSTQKEVKRDTPERKRQAFFSGVVFLTVSNILTKVCGLFLKVPLTNALGDIGMAYFNLAYAVYKWFYMIATAGLPVAVTVLTAEQTEDKIRGQTASPYLLSLSLRLFCGIGVVGTALMLAGSGIFASLQRAPDARYAILAIASSLLFICIAGAFRGWYHGLGEFLPTAVSQLAEAVMKTVGGLLLCRYGLQKGYSLPICAACTAVGVSVGCFSGMAVMAGFYPHIRKKYGLSHAGRPTGKTVSVGRLLKIAIPVTVSASVLSLTDMADSMLVIRRLEASGCGTEEALRLYGSYTALAIPMFHLPTILIYPITTAFVPLLTSAFQKKKEDAFVFRDTVRKTFRMALLVSMPCMLGISVMARPVLSLLFRPSLAETAAPLLSVLGIGILFVAVTASANAVLQATGNASLSVVAVVAGCAVKLLSGWILDGLPAVGIYGLPVSTVLSCFVTAAVGFAFLLSVLHPDFSLCGMCIKPLLASVGCILSAVGIRSALLSYGKEQTATALAIGCGMAVYVLLLFLFGEIRKADFGYFLRSGKGRRFAE